MIRLIQERDQQELIQLLNRDPISNYFILISYFGNLNKLAKIYGFFENQQMVAVLVIRNSGNAQFYGIQDVDPKELQDLLDAHEVSGLIAEKNCIGSFVKHFDYPRKTQATVMDLEVTTVVPQTEGSPQEIVELKGFDAPAIKKLYRICFQGSLSEEQIQKNLEEGTGRGFGIKNGEAMISVVQTIFENAQSAILFGVATDPDYRGRGYATILLAHLLQRLMAEGKSVHLMVEDPIAASLYQKLGFVKRTTLEKYQLR